MPMGVEAVRSALIAGDCIMVTQIAEPESKAGTYYTLRRSGKTVTKSAFAKLREELAPVDDELLTDVPQVFAIKSEA